MASSKKPQLTSTERESALKIVQLETSVASAKLDLKKKKRDDKYAIESAKLDLRSKRAAAEKIEAEARSAVRNLRLAESEDSLNCEYKFLKGVTDETVTAALVELDRISRMNPGAPITITLNSPGGLVNTGLALYDHIRELSARGHHMTVKVRGMAASMGGVMLQAGDTRVIGPRAMLMIHEPSGGTIGKLHDMEDRIAVTRRLWDMLADILAERSTMTADELIEKTKKFDWWLSAEEAVEQGFADQIG